MLFASPAVNATGPKATRIDLFSLKTVQMRAFHVTWMAFFVCFFAWFAAAPLMPLIAKDLKLTADQIANITIASVAVTIIVRMIIGPLCDKYGPRRTYTWLMLLGAIPVFGLAFANSYESFVFLRLCIGAIGASFVITQYHTSVMFAPNVVGTANATVGGWGNAGGGVTQTVMPILAAGLVSFGVQQAWGWRASLFVPGIAMVIMAFVYARYTQDTPQGDIVDLRRQGINVDSGKKGGWAIFAQAAANYRVWVLALAYAASFGVELYIHATVTFYYVNKFHLGLETAGLAAGIFGILALFARALGGIFSDRVAVSKGLGGRSILLFGLLLGEGLGLLLFAQMDTVGLAIITMSVFGLFTHMSCGAIYALMPFVDRKALGGVAGLIGAGGNVGAVVAGFIAKGYGSPTATLTMIGYIVLITSFATLLIRFSPVHKAKEQALLDEAVAQRNGWVPAGAAAMGD